LGRETSSFVGRSRDGAIRVGVISDTHGLLRPEALRALRGSDVLVHAGDVGNAAVLDGLRGLAPTFVVRGNNDTGAWAAKLPRTARLCVGTIELFVLHELRHLDLDPVAAGIGIVVSGHSHRPSVARRDGVVYVNPGSAGPRRFTLPVSVALLRIAGARIRTRIVELEC
jgi:putative phosphoesterase